MTNDLIVNNIRLINYTIFKMGLQKDLENFYDIGLKALVMAGNTYDKSKGCEFSSYAVSCIKNELLKYIKSEQCDKRKANYNTISFNKTLYTDASGNNVTLLDILNNNENLEEEIIKQEKIDLLKAIIDILEPNDRFMMLHYFELWGNKKMTQVEIAKKLNLNKRFVCYRINRAMRIIKKIMEDKYGKEN